MRAIFHRKFRKKLYRSEVYIQNKFYERLKIFYQNPYSYILNNHSVDHVFAGCRSINITGDWRAVYRQDDGAVVFVDIGTHSDLYG